MPLVLRLDIDKPYGRANFAQKVLSKVNENYFEIRLRPLGFLSYLQSFLEMLDQRNIKAFIYFRICSAPHPELIKYMDEKGHVIGFHAENTQSEKSFMDELQEFKKIVGRDIRHFSKHGSGIYKLGKRHFSLYEEDKYRTWAEKNGLHFPFGNGMVNPGSRFDKGNFYQDMYWVEPHYRKVGDYNPNWISERVKTEIIPIITHPENFYAENSTRDEFMSLLDTFEKNFITPAEFCKDWLT